MGQSPERPGDDRSPVGRRQRLQPARRRQPHEATQTATGGEKAMNTAAKILWAGLALMIVLFAGLASYHATDSTEVGVRTVKWLGQKGVEDKVYQPGAAYFFL